MAKEQSTLRRLLAVCVSCFTLVTSLSMSAIPASADMGTARLNLISTHSQKEVKGVYWEVAGEDLQPDATIVLPAGGSTCIELTWTLRRDPGGPMPVSMALVGSPAQPINFDVPIPQQACAAGGDKQAFTKIGPIDVDFQDDLFRWVVPKFRGIIVSVGSKCLPIDTWMDEVEGIGDYGDIYYMPELKIEPIKVASLVDIDGNSFYCQRGYTSGRVESEQRGVAKGHLVFTPEGCSGYKVCTASLGRNTYNLKDQKVRKSLECRSQSNLRPIVEDEVCLPVPKKSGKYRFEFFASNGRQVDRGNGWEFSCSYSFGTTRCGWYFDGDEAYVDSERKRRSVVVTSNDVVVRSIK